MTKADFELMMFNGGDGLTLDQIESLENALIENLPDGFIDVIRDDLGEDATENGIIESAFYQASDVFLGRLQDCATMLEIRDFMTYEYGMGLTDHQIYRLRFMEV